MYDELRLQGAESGKQLVKTGTDFSETANDLFEKALIDAKSELHPLLRTVDVARLNRRDEFVKAFKLALERRIAQKLAVSQPEIQAIFKFDESWMDSRDSWDGSIHLLVEVPKLSKTIKALGKKLDQGLTHCLQQLGWSRFRRRKSILEVQQVTLNELRHGIGYGAMFHAVYSVPVKVWSPKTKR